MPTVNEVLGGMLANAVAHPKSTIQGILTTTMTLTAALMAYPGIPVKYLAIAGGVQAVAKIGIGMLQSDGLQLPAGSQVTSDTHTTVKTPPAITTDPR